NSVCPAYDEVGNNRPQDGDENGSLICDIGSYEYPTPGIPATISISNGNNQQKQISQTFDNPLVVLIKDGYGNPVPAGINVTFTSPVSGASGIFASTGTNTETVQTDASGLATSSAYTANGTYGSYSVPVTVASLTANFSLQNLPIPGVPATISIFSG